MVKFHTALMNMSSLTTHPCDLRGQRRHLVWLAQCEGIYPPEQEVERNLKFSTK